MRGLSECDVSKQNLYQIKLYQIIHGGSHVFLDCSSIIHRFVREALWMIMVIMTLVWIVGATGSTGSSDSTGLLRRVLHSMAFQIPSNG